MQRMLTLGANVAGEDLGRAADRVDQAIRDAGELPPKVTVAVRGQIAPMRDLFGGLTAGLGVAVLVIFLLLAANFQSFRLSLAIVLTVPAVVAGVAIALWITRHDAQHSVVHGRDHGDRRGGGELDPAHHLCRAQPGRRAWP